MSKTLDALIAELNKKRCLVSSLIQINESEWRASIRKVDRLSSGEGKGKSALDALKSAWSHYTDDDAWSRRRRKSPPTKTKSPQKKSSRVRVKVK